MCDPSISLVAHESAAVVAGAADTRELLGRKAEMNSRGAGRVAGTG